jgi:putative methyltransferase (TIGR04325 family)
MSVLAKLAEAGRLLARSFSAGGTEPARAEMQFVGQYTDWTQARRASAGYDSEVIVQQALRSALKVRSGEAPYERDGVLFEKIEHSFPLLAALLLAALTEKRLSVLDFGGAFGSSYFQNRGFLRAIPGFKWGIVEQEKFVASGRRHIAGDGLGFFFSVEECVREINPNFVLLSGVLSYIPDPLAALRQLVKLDLPFLCFDRTLVAVQGETRLTVQVVPPQIYQASYPCWIIKEEELLAPLRERYRRAYEFAALGGVLRLDGILAAFKGYLYARADVAARHW